MTKSPHWIRDTTKNNEHQTITIDWVFQYKTLICGSWAILCSLSTIILRRNKIHLRKTETKTDTNHVQQRPQWWCTKDVSPSTKQNTVNGKQQGNGRHKTRKLWNITNNCCLSPEFHCPLSWQKYMIAYTHRRGDSHRACFKRIQLYVFTKLVSTDALSPTPSLFLPNTHWKSSMNRHAQLN